MASEEFEVVQIHLPKPQAAWLKARAVRHDRPVSAEGRSIFHFAMVAESLLGPTDVMYATAPAPAGEAA
jgi:plasmid stability protein